MSSIYDFLQSYGIWSVLMLLVAKFVLGVIVAVQKNEFKWFYLGEVMKNDGLKFVAWIIVIFTLSNPAFSASVGALLVADYTSGIVKNLAHLFPSIGDAIPSSFREPSVLRLGNPKQLR
jgi:hypothetical protein